MTNQKKPCLLWSFWGLQMVCQIAQSLSRFQISLALSPKSSILQNNFHFSPFFPAICIEPWYQTSPLPYFLHLYQKHEDKGSCLLAIRDSRVFINKNQLHMCKGLILIWHQDKPQGPNYRLKHGLLYQCHCVHPVLSMDIVSWVGSINFIPYL